MHRKTSVGSLIALFLVASVGAFGADKVKGMISSRTGETLIVSNQNEKVTVLLSDDTKTKDDTGLFGLDKQDMSNAVLVPGLKVDIDGSTDDAGRFAFQGVAPGRYRLRATHLGFAPVDLTIAVSTDSATLEARIMTMRASRSAVG